MNYDQLVETFWDERPWLRVEANRSFLLSAAGTPVTMQGLCRAADRLGNQLVIAADFNFAWREFISRRPEFDLQANRNICFSSLNPYEQPSADAFCEIADRQNSPLRINAAATAQIEEQQRRGRNQKEGEQRRAELIDQISHRGATKDERGQPVFTAFSAVSKLKRWFPVSILADLSLQQLEELAVSGCVTTEVTAQPKKQEEAPISLLINPDTNPPREYTRKELWRMTREQIRPLLFHGSGLPITGRKERFTEIIEGRVKPQGSGE